MAVLAILLFHVMEITGRVRDDVIGKAAIALGGQAVALFFAISGFLLYRPFLSARARGRARPSTREFLRRRALRIVPGYWVALTALAIWPGVVGAFGDHWWRYYGFLQLYWPSSVGGGLPVAWTLSVEVSFYAILPLWALVVRPLRIGAGPSAWVRGELAAVGAGIAAGTALRVMAAQQVLPRTVADSLPGQLPWLALGMGLAVLSVAAESSEAEGRARRLIRARSGLCWVAAAGLFAGLTALAPSGGLFGLIAAVSTVQPAPEALGRVVLSIPLIGLVMAPAVFAEDVRALPQRVLGLRSLAWIGMVSFSLYLWHLTLAEVIALDRDPLHFSARGLGLVEHVDRAQTPLLFVLALGAASAIAAVTYRYVELPFIRRAGSASRALRRRF